MKSNAWILLTALAGAATNAVAAAACEVRSGKGTAALVELYTSEGCSSCPPADEALSKLRKQLDPGATVVPLALHVSYWDQIGWKDVFAQKIFDDRQRQLLVNKKQRVVYTPQFFVNGAELRQWRSDLVDSVRQVNAIAAPVSITLKSTPVASGRAMIEADVEAIRGKEINGALYLAVSENALVSKVLRGENSGATLRHDDTVRQWFGPVALSDGRARIAQEITIPAGWKRENLQAVAFVQAQQDGRILQAVSSGQCMPAGGL